MPNPKRRHSKTRGRKRRTHWTLDPVNVGSCPKCKQARLSHHICSHCGFYNGREVLQIEAEA